MERVSHAALNQEFFDTLFGKDEIHSEEEAKARIREHLASPHASRSEALLLRDFQNHLLAENPVPLPEAFLKRWLVATNEELDEEKVNSYYEHFAKNLHWSLIREKLMARYQIEVSEEEVYEGMKTKVRSVLGAYANEETVLRLADNLLDDEKQYSRAAEEIITDKLYQALEKEADITVAADPMDAFNHMLEEARRSAEDTRAIAEALEEEE